MPATICTGIKKLSKSYTLLKCILVYWHYRNLASDFVCLPTTSMFLPTTSIFLTSLVSTGSQALI